MSQATINKRKKKEEVISQQSLVSSQ